MPLVWTLLRVKTVGFVTQPKKTPQAQGRYPPPQKPPVKIQVA